MAEEYKIGDAVVELRTEGGEGLKRDLQDATRSSEEFNRKQKELKRLLAEQTAGPAGSALGGGAADPARVTANNQADVIRQMRDQVLATRTDPYKAAEAALRGMGKERAGFDVRQARLNLDPNYAASERQRVLGSLGAQRGAEEYGEDVQRRHGFRVLGSLRRQKQREEATQAKEEERAEKAATREKADADKQAAKQAATLASGMKSVASALGGGRLASVLGGGGGGGFGGAGGAAAAGAGGMSAAAIGGVALGAAAVGIAAGTYVLNEMEKSARRNVALGAPGVALEAEMAERSLSFAAGRQQAGFQQWLNKNKFIAAGSVAAGGSQSAFGAWMAENMPGMTASGVWLRGGKAEQDRLEKIGREQASSGMLGRGFGNAELYMAIQEAVSQMPVDFGGARRDVNGKVLD